jgi:16S rRNA (cytidine1402-2'-O)-methyltransferase
MVGVSFPVQSYAFLHGQGRGFLCRRMIFLGHHPLSFIKARFEFMSFPVTNRIEDRLIRFNLMSSSQGILYVVSTPIGNLEDITLRALRILKEVDLVAAEDTRRTGLLLKHFGIEKPLTSYFEGNELKKRELILSRLREGEDVALVSDAGTPGISDPGFRLIRLAIEHEISIVPVPGPSAVIAALSVAGLPTDAFLFKGFLPHKSKKRRDLLKQMEDLRETLIFYESPHRLSESLKDIFEILGDREISLTRELTKVYEEVLRGKVSALLRHIGEKTLKGEITLIVSGKTRKETTLHFSDGRPQ